MYAILTYSTDQTRPNYKIEFTTSKKKVKEALNYKIKTTYEDPELAQNWHNDLKSIYEMPTGWRKPSQKYIKDEVRRMSGSIYSPNENGIIAREIFRAGIEIKNID